MSATSAIMFLTPSDSCPTYNTQPDVVPTVIVANGAPQVVQSGATLQLIVRVTDKRAQVVSAPVIEWSSSDVTIASVAPNGVLTATTIGTATITADQIPYSQAGPITLTVYRTHIEPKVIGSKGYVLTSISKCSIMINLK